MNNLIFRRDKSVQKPLVKIKKIKNKLNSGRKVYIIEPCRQSDDLVMVVVEGMVVVHRFAANPGLLEAVLELIGLVLVHLYLQEYLS